jgi:hypothetical protein
VPAVCKAISALLPGVTEPEHVREVRTILQPPAEEGNRSYLSTEAIVPQIRAGGEDDRAMR